MNLSELRVCEVERGWGGGGGGQLKERVLEEGQPGEKGLGEEWLGMFILTPLS